jgi:NO-binding membrane sensor protein with MHYT domain
MLILGRILATLSLLTLGAHFLRSGSYLPMALAIVATALVYYRRTWSLWSVQLALGLAIVEWTRTIVSLVAMREAMGLAYGRMAAILALVAVVCLAALVALTARRARAHYAHAPVDGDMPVLDRVART